MTSPNAHTPADLPETTPEAQPDRVDAPESAEPRAPLPAKPHDEGRCCGACGGA